MRRLFGGIQLPQRRAEGNAVRPQAPDQPVLLQQGFFLRQRLLSELCHRRGRDAAQEARRRTSTSWRAREACPQPERRRLATPFNLLVTGVGGTGVITVGALVAMAAHLEGKGASVLDFTGFAQKFGPVLSFIRLVGKP